MIKLLYFSPTGGTRQIARALASQLLKKRTDLTLTEIDLSSPAAREKTYSFAENDIVILASPTYAGRLPNKIMPFFRDNLSGNGARCIALVSFGNRSYDNSLLEMVRLMEANDFSVIAGAALVCRHSMCQTLGQGRPEQKDMEDIATLAASISAKLDDSSAETLSLQGEVGPYYVPKKEDGSKAVFLKAKPKIHPSLCTSCGKCADVCVMGSISQEAPYETTSICIKCQACIHACPAGARYFDDDDLLSHIRMLESNYSRIRQENRILL